MTDAWSLGATLYMPATRSDLGHNLYGGGIPGLRSAVLCLEDAVAKRDLPSALANVTALLRAAPRSGGPLVFIRPRHPEMLERLLCLPGIERIAGFVLPKVTPTTLPDYLAHPLHPGHWLMPTLETCEAFDPCQLRQLRDQMLAVQHRILTVRIGGNDLLQCLGVRRPRDRTAYDGPLGPIIAVLAGTFLPYGFALSAPVMEQFDDPALLRAEMLRDLEQGLSSKTAIHPSQLPVIQGGLAVSASALAEAEALLDPSAPAVFASRGRLAEPATHRRWAEAIIRRAALYGVADSLPLMARQA